jgi:hypothetical protein
MKFGRIAPKMEGGGNNRQNQLFSLGEVAGMSLLPILNRREEMAHII